MDHERSGMALFWLSDETQAAIEPHLPGKRPTARRLDRIMTVSHYLLLTSIHSCNIHTYLYE